MALANTTRKEVDIIIREYETRFIDAVDGSKIAEPKEEKTGEIHQYKFGSLIEAIKYLALKL